MRCDRVIYKTPLSLKAFSTFIAQDADSVGYHVAFHRPCCTLDLSTNLTALYLESRGPRWKSHKHETKRCCESSSWLISDERESVDPEIIHSSDMWSDVCNVCGKQPDICANFWEHMELWILNGEKNFPCHICGQSYSTKQYLQIHTGQHTGEKSHCCEECGKAFADPSALKNHQKQYQHNQPVACEVCGKTFKIKKNLKSHMMIHNNGGMMADATQTDSGKRIYSNDFKLEVLKKVQEIGLSATAKLVGYS